MQPLVIRAMPGGFLGCGLLLALALDAVASPLAAVFSNADEAAVSAPAFDAAGRSIDITLAFAPVTGTPLTVVDQSGLGFIEGTFTNLAHGQLVDLEHGGKTYRYVANYYGGDGNDLVLQWAATRPLAWGYNDAGQLGNGGTNSTTLATAVDTTGVLAGKTILAVAMGGKHSLALCSDGTLAAWGANNNGQLGNNSMAASSPVPVQVVQTGVLAGKTVIAIAAGEEHSLALCSDGTVAAWGTSIYGMIGDGAFTDRRVPVAVNTSGVLAGKTVVRIAAGRRHSLAVCSDGTAAGWGFNGSGQLGNGQALISNPLPLAVDQSGVLAGKQIAALAGGEHFTLALCTDGTLASWGSNNSGLGTGVGYMSSNVPLLVNQSGVLAGRTVVEIATGYSHALARCTDGFLAGWGANFYGSLGDGTLSDQLLPVAVVNTGILSGRTPRDLAAAGYFSFALNRDGILASWGWNGSGQLGDNSIENRREPIEVIASHLPEGETFCGIGNGSSANHAVGIVAVPFEPRMRVVHTDLRIRLDGSATLDFGAVSAGGPVGQSLVIHNDGIEPLTITDVSLSGDHAGDFSYGTPHASPIAPGSSATLPVTFTPGAGFHRRASLNIGSNDPYRDAFVVDLSATVTGTLAVSLGDPRIPALTTKAITVTGSTILPTLSAQPPVGTTFTLVENTGSEFIAGAFANLAHGQVIPLNFAGTTYRFIANYYGGSGNDLVLQWATTRPVGWGENFADQMLTGSTESVLEPTAIPTSGALAGKTIISTTSSHGFNLALCTDGSIVGWGRNTQGQLGNGSTATSSPPVEVNRSGVLAGRTVIAIDAGYVHCLALCADGGIVAWGTDYGNLPVNVTLSAEMSGKRVVAIDAGSHFENLALCSDGSVFQWSASPTSQLTEVHRLRTLRNRAVDVISSGGGFCLALCSDGTLVSWGSNNWGKLGIGTGEEPPGDEPLSVDTSGVLAGKTVRAISAGYSHAIALCDDGTLATWGSNFYGELGNGLTGSSNNSNAPAAVIQSGILAGRTPVSVAAAYQFCVTGLAGGGVAAWGEDPLGKGDFVSSSTPVEVFTRSLASGERLLPPTPGHYSTHNLALVAIPHLPRLSIAHDSGIRVANDRFTADLGAASAGGQLETTFTLRNDGIEALAINSVSIIGRDAADFSVVTTPPSSIAQGASAPLVVRFTAGSGLAREAVLEISSNDPNNNLFEIGLAATVSGTLSAEWPDAASVPLSATALTATGSAVNLSLNHLPQTGSELMLVEITGMDFIIGRFDNLAQGQEVALSYGGKTYRFVANYYGGSGNDLVLQWAALQPFGWGLNTSGQLGDGTTTTRFLPGRASVGVLAGRSPVAMAARSNHTLALCADGGLAAWGSNSSGQFGRGNSTSSNVPVAAGTTGVMVGKTIAAIATGNSHTLALCTDGSLAAWGSNSNGQLGNGSTSTSTNPVAVDQTGVLAGRRVVAISAGNFHNLALCSDGTIAAWGGNISSQLGDQTTTNRNRPVEVTATGALTGRRVVAIAAGSSHSMALSDDGAIVAWGSNEFGKLGNGGTSNSNVPVEVDRTGVLAGKSVIGIAAGESFSLALCDDGQIAAWGDNTSRQFGNGETVSSALPVVVQMENALGGRLAHQVSVGRSHSLAQGPPGSPAAWGHNANGRLGDGTNLIRSKPVSVAVTNLLAGEIFIQTAITQGHDHSAALVALPYIPRIALQRGASAPYPSSGGSLFFEPKGIGVTTTETLTLRNNGIVPLELGTIAITGPHADEFQITTAPPAVLTAGESATLAITFTAGSGFGRSAELFVPSNDPHVPEIRLALESSGSGALVASYATGAEVPLQISKFNPTGSTLSLSLGYLPPTGTSLMLVDVTGREFIRGAFANLAPGQEVVLDFNGRSYSFIANYYGGSGNDLVLEWAAARPVAWGRNSSGQLGTGDVLQRSIATDIASGGVLAGKRVTALAAGASHSLALCADGTLAAWGSNGSGRLGNGSTTSSSLPVAVSRSGAFAGKTVVSIAAGGMHSLALCSDGTVFAWGNNFYGQLGNGSPASSNLPVAVTTTGVLAGKFVTAIAAGNQHSLALCSDGTVVSWGNNSSGQLGTSQYLSSSTAPVAVHMAGVLAGKTVTAIAAGASHSLALCADGTLAAWGSNASGQLGTGFAYVSDIPELVYTSGVLSGRTVVGIAAGLGHSMALCADGSVAAWGDNTWGQLGNGSISTSTYPVLTSAAGFTPLRISSGYRHSMMSGSPGSTALWGQNAYGQLGDGTLSNRSVPTTMSSAWQLPGDLLLATFAGPLAEHTLGLAAEPVAPRIEEWRLLHFQTRENAGIAADTATPANDSVTNLMKFATGMDPWTAGPPLIHARLDGDTLFFTYPRSKAALADGLNFHIEASHDLAAGSWQRLDDIVETIEDFGPLQQVTVSVQAQSSPTLFLRLKVHALEP
jgi:alpha-tubulin suppressor-like RCC1 family protein